MEEKREDDDNISDAAELFSEEAVVSAEESSFVLTDEEGNEFIFKLLDFVDYDEKLYALLAPEDADLDDEDEELDIVVMEVVVENENPSFNLIEDEKLASAVLDAFVQKAIDEAEEDED